MGCASCALSRSEQLRWLGPWWVHSPRWTVCLIHIPGHGCSVSWCATRAQPQVCYVSPLGSWSQTVIHLVAVKHPGSQEDVVGNWQPAHSLVEDVVFDTKIAAAPCLQSLVVTHLPLCLWGGRALYCSWLAFLWKVSLFFFCLFLYVSHNLGYYLTLAPYNYPPDVHAWSLPSGPLMQPLSLCPAPTHWWLMWASVPPLHLY